MSRASRGSVTVGRPVEKSSEPGGGHVKSRPCRGAASRPSVGGSHGGGANEASRPPRTLTPRIRRNTPPADWWLPDWVREHVDSNRPVDDLIAEAVRRVAGSPHEATIVTVQTLFNELSRNPDHAAAVRVAVRTLLDKHLRRRAS
jgi:hypothetical protein